MVRLNVIAVAGLVCAACGLSGVGHAQSNSAGAGTGYCWIDSLTGKPVKTGPPGWDPILEPDRAYSGGHNYSKQPDGTWIDSLTGKAVKTGPPGWDPILLIAPTLVVIITFGFPANRPTNQREYR